MSSDGGFPDGPNLAFQTAPSPALWPIDGGLYDIRGREFDNEASFPSISETTITDCDTNTRDHVFYNTTAAVDCMITPKLQAGFAAPAANDYHTAMIMRKGNNTTSLDWFFPDSNILSNDPAWEFDVGASTFSENQNAQIAFDVDSSNNRFRMQITHKNFDVAAPGSVTSFTDWVSPLPTLTSTNAVTNGEQSWFCVTVDQTNIPQTAVNDSLDGTERSMFWVESDYTIKVYHKNPSTEEIESWTLNLSGNSYLYASSVDLTPVTNITPITNGRFVWLQGTGRVAHLWTAANLINGRNMYVNWLRNYASYTNPPYC